MMLLLLFVVVVVVGIAVNVVHVAVVVNVVDITRGQQQLQQPLLTRRGSEIGHPAIKGIHCQAQRQGDPQFYVAGIQNITVLCLAVLFPQH